MSHKRTRACLAATRTLSTAALFLFSALSIDCQQPSQPKLSQGPQTMEPQSMLMPEPASLTRATGTLPLSAAFAVTLDGPPSERMHAALARSLSQIQTRTGIAATDMGAQPSADAPRLTIHYSSKGPAIQTLNEDESYHLTVSSSGVSIGAPTVLGAMHGLATLVQLIEITPAGPTLPLVTIQDSPRFPWRGLMIDTGRHFEPIQVLKRNIDGMAAVKLNVFHWHLTEDQGFRIESKKFPLLTEKGSRNGEFYTQAQARDLVAYARARGIRVVPEFEMPGHSQAWQVAYPALASGTPPTHIRNRFGIADYALDPTREETYTFIQAFLAEMTTIFPDEYVHIGGDESPAPDWKQNPRILAFMQAHNLKDSPALQAYFNLRIDKILTGLNKRMVGWDEILNPALPRNVVIQSWRGVASLSAGAQQGFEGVLSAPYYLDAMKPAGEHYLADPIPADTTLTPAQQKLILGGEVCMWAEQINPLSIDSRIWPRTAAMAERFWSPASVRDVDSMYRRLEPVSLELAALGLTHLSHEDAALEQLAGSEHILALQTFASVLEPVSFSERYQQQHTSQSTALDLLVDALPPDQPSRRDFARLTSAFLAHPRDAAAKTALLNRYAQLSAAIPEVQHLIGTRPLLGNMKTRADQLTALAQTATEAINYLSTQTVPPANWKASATALVADAKHPSAIVRFTFLDSLTELIDAVPAS